MSGKKDEGRPIFILWDYTTSGQEGNIVHIRKRRNSAKYLALAEWLVENPPNKKPFHPRDDLGKANLGNAAHALQTYREDVETWVATRMMNAIVNDSEFTDEDLFPNVLRELHELPWYPGSKWKGFYYVQPMVMRIRPADRQTGWAFDAMGKKVPYMKAEGLHGYWYEPSLRESELWNTRLAINNLRRTVERFAEAALSGRSIGHLNPAQHWYLVNAAISTMQKSLPPAVVNEERKILSEGPQSKKE